MPSSFHEQLLQRLRDRTAVIGIAGLGYVGLPLAMCFRDAGYRVTGFDNDPAKAASLDSGRIYIERIPASAIEELRRGGFEATGDYARAIDVDALIICVPTPLTRHQEPDLSFVLKITLESFLPHMRAGQVVSLESTTYPGTTDETAQALPEDESRGKQRETGGERGPAQQRRRPADEALGLPGWGVLSKEDGVGAQRDGGDRRRQDRAARRAAHGVVESETNR